MATLASLPYYLPPPDREPSPFAQYWHGFFQVRNPQAQLVFQENLKRGPVDNSQAINDLIKQKQEYVKGLQDTMVKYRQSDATERNAQLGLLQSMHSDYTDIFQTQTTESGKGLRQEYKFKAEELERAKLPDHVADMTQNTATAIASLLTPDADGRTNIPGAEAAMTTFLADIKGEKLTTQQNNAIFRAVASAAQSQAENLDGTGQQAMGAMLGRAGGQLGVQGEPDTPELRFGGGNKAMLNKLAGVAEGFNFGLDLGGSGQSQGVSGSIPGMGGGGGGGGTGYTVPPSLENDPFVQQMNAQLKALQAGHGRRRKSLTIQDGAAKEDIGLDAVEQLEKDPTLAVDAMMATDRAMDADVKGGRNKDLALMDSMQDVRGERRADKANQKLLSTVDMPVGGGDSNVRDWSGQENPEAALLDQATADTEKASGGVKDRVKGTGAGGKKKEAAPEPGYSEVDPAEPSSVPAMAPAPAPKKYGVQRSARRDPEPKPGARASLIEALPISEGAEESLRGVTSGVYDAVMKNYRGRDQWEEDKWNNKSPAEKEASQDKAIMDMYYGEPGGTEETEEEKRKRKRQETLKQLGR